MKIYLTGSARHCPLCASYLGQYTVRVSRKQPNSKQHLLHVQLSSLLGTGTCMVGYLWLGEGGG